MANRRSESLVPEWAIPTVALISLSLFLLPGFRPVAVTAGVIAVVALGFFIFQSIRRTLQGAEFRAASLRGHPAARFTQRQHNHEPVRWTRQRLIELCAAGTEPQIVNLLTAVFQREGYAVQRLGEVALLIEKDDEQTVIQFEHWNASVLTGAEVRDFHAALLESRFEHGILVNLRGCTKEAQNLATDHAITLLNENLLVEKICGGNGAIAPEILTLLHKSEPVTAAH